MSPDERMTALEARLAAAEARIAKLEAKPAIPCIGPSVPYYFPSSTSNPIDSCPCNPANGGSGVCGCVLGGIRTCWVGLHD